MADTLSTSLRQSAADALTLRILGPDGRGRLVRPKANQIAIGADEKCALRLRGAAFQPTHCVIVCQADGVRVRKLADPTWLNDRSFEESALAAGDCLRVGPVEIEVVAAPRPADAKRETPPASQPAGHVHQASPERSTGEDEPADSRLAQLDSIHERLDTMERLHASEQLAQEAWQAQQQALWSGIERRADEVAAFVATLQREEADRGDWTSLVQAMTNRLDELEQRQSRLGTPAAPASDQQWLATQISEITQRVEQLSWDWQAVRKASQDRYSQWVSEREELKGEMQDRLGELEGRLDGVGQLESSPRLEQWQQEYERQSAELAGIAQRADQRLDDLDCQGEASRAQWAAWMAEHESFKAELQARVRQLDDSLAELRNELAIANQQRQAMQEAFEESQTKLTARSEELETCLVELAPSKWRLSKSVRLGRPSGAGGDQPDHADRATRRTDRRD